MTPHYEVLIVARTPAQTGYPTLEMVERIVPLRNLSWSDNLSDDNQSSVGVSPVGLPESVAERFRDLANNPCELWIYREGDLVYAGPVLGIQNQGEALIVVSRGVLYYLRYMFIQRDMTFTNVSPFKIVKDMIDQWEQTDKGAADEYANFGIDTSNIDTTGAPVDENDNLIRRTLKFTGEELVNVRTKIQEISEVRKIGFDYYIDLSTFRSDNGLGQFGPNARRELKLINRVGMGRGVDRSDDIVLELRNLRDMRLWSSVSAGDIATWFKVLGTSEDRRATASSENATLKANFGKVGEVAHLNDTARTADLLEAAETGLEARGDFFVKVGGNQEGASIFSMPGMDAVSFNPGDIITLLWDPGYGLIHTQRQVFKKWVSIDPTGTEKMTLEFR